MQQMLQMMPLYGSCMKAAWACHRDGHYLGRAVLYLRYASQCAKQARCSLLSTSLAGFTRDIKFRSLLLHCHGMLWADAIHCSRSKLRLTADSMKVWHGKVSKSGGTCDSCFHLRVSRLKLHTSPLALSLPPKMTMQSPMTTAECRYLAAGF